MSNAHLHVLDAESGRWVPATVDGLGVSAGGGGLGGGGGGAASADDWSYVAGSGGITDTSAVTLVAAGGNGTVNYLTGIQILNTDGSVGTEVTISSGATVLWRTYLGTSNTQPMQVEFSRPLRADTNTAITAACGTTSAAVYINAQGFTTGDVERLEDIVDTNFVELYDASQNPIVDAAGTQIIVGA